MPKKPTLGKRGLRYSQERKGAILTVARKEGLTGAQVAKRFGISTLTFYRWRGPVRSDAVARKGRKRGPGRSFGSGRAKVDVAAIRREVQAQVRRLLSQIIREEVAAALAGGARRR